MRATAPAWLTPVSQENISVHPLTMRTLRLLAAGDFRSGEEMARALGVSRASVFNALHALDGEGIEIFKVRGRGYRLAEPLVLLDSARVIQALGAEAPRFGVQVLDRVDSTNTLALQHASAGAPGGTVIAAEWQSEGRGRRGRAWHAAIGASLTFSLLWRFQQGAGHLGGLSLAVGVAVARALLKLGVDPVGLKWPNDVLWKDAKLAGILIEASGDMLGPSAAVIGIGVNCRLSEELQGRIDQPVSDLATAVGKAVDRNRTLALLLLELAGVLGQFAQTGFSAFREEWHRHHVHQDKNVNLYHADGSTASGIARGVSIDGSLLLATAAGERAYHSGEVSSRAKGRG